MFFVFYRVFFILDVLMAALTMALFLTDSMRFRFLSIKLLTDSICERGAADPIRFDLVRGAADSLRFRALRRAAQPI